MSKDPMTQKSKSAKKGSASPANGAKKTEMMPAWVSLIHAATFLSESLDETLQAKVGISFPEQDLLKQLAVNDASLTLTQVAERVFLSKAGLTKMLDRMEKQGLVRRVAAEEDRRSVRAVLTPKGKRRFGESRDVIQGFVAENFGAHLKAKQIQNLKEILQSLLTGLGRWEGQARHLQGDPHSSDSNG